MAKYRIVDRRKKVSPMAAPAPEQESVQTNAPSIASGDEAFRMYEKFFDATAEDGTVPSRVPAEKEEDVRIFDEAPQTEEPAPVTEETVEFSLEDVRRAFAVEEKARPAEEKEDIPPEKSAADMKEFFSTLFGESTPAVPVAPTAPVPGAATIGIPAFDSAEEKESTPAMGDTIQIPKTLHSTPENTVTSDTIQVPQDGGVPKIDHFESLDSADVLDPADRAAAGTRVTIQDLISDTPATENKEAQPEEVLDFSRPEDADAILTEHKKKGVSLWRRFGMLAVLFVCSLYLESATYNFGISLPLPEFLTPGRFGIVYLLVDLQLLILAVAASFSHIKRGVRGLFSGKATSDSFVFASLSVTVLHVVSLLIFFATSEEYVLFGALSVFLALCAALRAVFSHRANTLALNLLTADGEKFAAAKMDEDSPEVAAFSDHIEEEIPEVYSVSRTKFAEGFLRRTQEVPAGTSFAVAVPLLLLLSVGVAVWCFVGGGAKSAVLAINAFVLSMMMGLPVASIFSHTLPFFFAQRRAAKTGAALLGESAVEEAGSAEIVSFDDTEVFLPKHVKVTSVRTYGSARIDKILIYCAQIFREVGGPLSFVFENSISSLCVPGVVEILENDGDGICARIDGKEMYLGSCSYLEAYEFLVELDEQDTVYENTVGRIMYLALDGELAAKFYIKYAVSARFCTQLAALNHAGLYAAVKTCDPNVDAVLLQKILGNPEYPIGVIKTGSAAKNAEAVEKLDAPIVATSKISAVLNGFLLCDGVRSRASLGTLAKYVSMLLGVFITFVLTGMQNAGLTPLVCLYYQLIWLLPVVIPSFFDWPRPPRRVKKRK